MSSNQEVIQKADMALADLATAGRLNPEQTNRFMRKVMDEPTILNASRFVAMSGPEKKINKIGFGSRILRPAVSAQALAASDRVKPTTEQITLLTKEVMAEIILPYDVLEDNIEGGKVSGKMQETAGGLHDTVIDLIGKRAALDLEELALLGDTTSGDPYLALHNGWLKLANLNAVAAGGVAYSKDIVKSVVKTMPDKYLRNRASMVHFVSVDQETELRDQFANRQTAGGDQYLTGAGPLWVYGSQVKGAAKMPGTTSLYSDPKNLIFGVQRDVSIEFDKDIRARTFIIVLTTRIALQVEETEAVVKTTGLLP